MKAIYRQDHVNIYILRYILLPEVLANRKRIQTVCMISSPCPYICISQICIHGWYAMVYLTLGKFYMALILNWKSKAPERSGMILFADLKQHSKLRSALVNADLQSIYSRFRTEKHCRRTRWRFSWYFLLLRTFHIRILLHVWVKHIDYCYTESKQ